MKRIDASFAAIREGELRDDSEHQRFSQPTEERHDGYEDQSAPLPGDEPTEDGTDRHGLTVRREPSGSVRDGRL